MRSPQETQDLLRQEATILGQIEYNSFTVTKKEIHRDGTLFLWYGSREMDLYEFNPDEVTMFQDDFRRIRRGTKVKLGFHTIRGTLLSVGI